MTDDEVNEYHQLLDERERLQNQLDLVNLRHEVTRLKDRLARERVAGYH